MVPVVLRNIETVLFRSVSPVLKCMPLTTLRPVLVLSLTVLFPRVVAPLTKSTVGVVGRLSLLRTSCGLVIPEWCSRTVFVELEVMPPLKCAAVNVEEFGLVWTTIMVVPNVSSVVFLLFWPLTNRVFLTLIAVPAMTVVLVLVVMPLVMTMWCRAIPADLGVEVGLSIRSVGREFAGVLWVLWNLTLLTSMSCVLTISRTCFFRMDMS